MKNDSANTKSRPRSRKKTTPSAQPVAADSPTAAPEDGKNVGALESAFSLGLGVLFLVGALFPRSIKQLLLLGLGGGLLYRGMTSHCGLYQALGLNSAQGSLLEQINEKYLTDPQRKNG